MEETTVEHLLPYLTWKAPFGKTGILPLIASIISQYAPNDIHINITSAFLRASRDISQLHGFVHPQTHHTVILLAGLLNAEIITIPNYQTFCHCTDDDIWTNQIKITRHSTHKFHIQQYTNEIISISEQHLATKHKVVTISDRSLQLQYSTCSDNLIIDMWLQLNYPDTDFILKRAANSSLVDIMQITQSTKSTLFRLTLPDTLIVDKHCCYVVNDNIAFLVYHLYNFQTCVFKLALRYCCKSTTNTDEEDEKVEVGDIEIPLSLLNHTYSKILSCDKVYIMNIAQKYFFYHQQSDYYLLFMDLTYRFNDALNGNKRRRRSMQFESSVFMWQFQIDWTHKCITNIAISAVNQDLSLNDKNGTYQLLCFDESNGAAVLVDREKKCDFVVKKLSDVVKEWKYYSP